MTSTLASPSRVTRTTPARGSASSPRLTSTSSPAARRSDQTSSSRTARSTTSRSRSAVTRETPWAARLRLRSSRRRSRGRSGGPRPRRGGSSEQVLQAAGLAPPCLGAALEQNPGALGSEPARGAVGLEAAAPQLERESNPFGGRERRHARALGLAQRICDGLATHPQMLPARPALGHSHPRSERFRSDATSGRSRGAICDPIHRVVPRGRICSQMDTTRHRQLGADRRWTAPADGREERGIPRRGEVVSAEGIEPST